MAILPYGNVLSMNNVGIMCNHKIIINVQFIFKIVCLALTVILKRARNRETNTSTRSISYVNLRIRFNAYTLVSLENKVLNINIRNCAYVSVTYELENRTLAFFNFYVTFKHISCYSSN